MGCLYICVLLKQRAVLSTFFFFRVSLTQKTHSQKKKCCKPHIYSFCNADKLLFGFLCPFMNAFYYSLKVHISQCECSSSIVLSIKLCFPYYLLPSTRDREKKDPSVFILTQIFRLLIRHVSWHVSTIEQHVSFL